MYDIIPVKADVWIGELCDGKGLRYEFRRIPGDSACCGKTEGYTTALHDDQQKAHSWRVSLMAMLSRQEFPDVNSDRVVDMCLIHDLGECFTGDIPTFVKTDLDRSTEDSLLQQWVTALPGGISKYLSELYAEMDQQITVEAKLYKALDKLEALIQHNESPIDTWSENEYELNKTYAFDTVAFSDWLLALRQSILEETLNKIAHEDGK